MTHAIAPASSPASAPVPIPLPASAPSPLRSTDVARVTVTLTLWALAAITIALSGALTLERRALVPASIVVTLLALFIAYRAGGAFRRVADIIPLHALVLLHTARAPIGVGFFVLAATRGLDDTFTDVAGWGDLAVGLLAPLASLALPALTPRRLRLVVLWNVVGAIDISMAFVTAQRALIFGDHPESMSALLTFPGPLLPLLIVPVVIATHALIALRLLRGDRA